MTRGRKPRRARRVDKAQPAMVDSLRSIPGIQVDVLSDVGGGFPDLAVSGRGRTILVEVKNPGQEDDLTPDEEAWWEDFPGDGMVASSSVEVLMELGFMSAKEGQGWLEAGVRFPGWGKDIPPF